MEPAAGRSKGADANLGVVEKETRVGAAMTDLINRRVILGVLVLVFVVPFFIRMPTDDGSDYAVTTIYSFAAVLVAAQLSVATIYSNCTGAPMPSDIFSFASFSQHRRTQLMDSAAIVFAEGTQSPAQIQGDKYASRSLLASNDSYDTYFGPDFTAAVSAYQSMFEMAVADAWFHMAQFLQLSALERMAVRNIRTDSLNNTGRTSRSPLDQLRDSEIGTIEKYGLGVCITDLWDNGNGTAASRNQTLLTFCSISHPTYSTLAPLRSNVQVTAFSPKEAVGLYIPPSYYGDISSLDVLPSAKVRILAKVAKFSAHLVEIDKDMWNPQGNAEMPQELLRESLRRAFPSSVVTMQPFSVRAWFSKQSDAITDAKWDMALTAAVIIALSLGAVAFSFDVNRIVLRPLSLVVDVVKKISINPLDPFGRARPTHTSSEHAGIFPQNSLPSEHTLTPSEGGELSNADSNEVSHFSAAGAAALEIRMLIHTVLNIGLLMTMVFGRKGTEILLRCLNNNKELNPCCHGTRRYGIFANISIPLQDLLYEQLREDAPPLINGIMRIIHDICASHGGSILRTDSTGVLIYWSLPDIADPLPPDESSKTVAWSKWADLALLFAIRLQLELSRRSMEFFGDNDSYSKAAGWALIDSRQRTTARSRSRRRIVQTHPSFRKHANTSASARTQSSRTAFLSRKARTWLQQVVPTRCIADLVTTTIHAGPCWEGPIGSDRKIDITCVSPHVTFVRDRLPYELRMIRERCASLFHSAKEDTSRLASVQLPQNSQSDSERSKLTSFLQTGSFVSPRLLFSESVHGLLSTEARSCAAFIGYLASDIRSNSLRSDFEPWAVSKGTQSDHIARQPQPFLAEDMLASFLNSTSEACLQSSCRVYSFEMDPTLLYCLAGVASLVIQSYHTVSTARVLNPRDAQHLPDSLLGPENAAVQPAADIISSRRSFRRFANTFLDQGAPDKIGATFLSRGNPATERKPFGRFRNGFFGRSIAAIPATQSAAQEGGNDGAAGATDDASICNQTCNKGPGLRPEMPSTPNNSSFNDESAIESDRGTSTCDDQRMKGLRQPSVQEVLCTISGSDARLSTHYRTSIRLYLAGHSCDPDPTSRPMSVQRLPDIPTRSSLTARKSSVPLRNVFKPLGEQTGADTYKSINNKSKEQVSPVAPSPEQVLLSSLPATSPIKRRSNDLRRTTSSSELHSVPKSEQTQTGTNASIKSPQQPSHPTTELSLLSPVVSTMGITSAPPANRVPPLRLPSLRMDDQKHKNAPASGVVGLQGDTFTVLPLHDQADRAFESGTGKGGRIPEEPAPLTTILYRNQLVTLLSRNFLFFATSPLEILVPSGRPLDVDAAASPIAAYSPSIWTSDKAIRLLRRPRHSPGSQEIAGQKSTRVRSEQLVEQVLSMLIHSATGHIASNAVLQRDLVLTAKELAEFRGWTQFIAALSSSSGEIGDDNTVSSSELLRVGPDNLSTSNHEPPCFLSTSLLRRSIMVLCIDALLLCGDGGTTALAAKSSLCLFLLFAALQKSPENDESGGAEKESDIWANLPLMRECLSSFE
jgi:hypothetical protein